MIRFGCAPWMLSIVYPGFPDEHYLDAGISASTTYRLILRVVVLGNSSSRRVNRLIRL
jgi:hypothetical protein